MRRLGPIAGLLLPLLPLGSTACAPELAAVSCEVDADCAAGACEDGRCVTPDDPDDGGPPPPPPPPGDGGPPPPPPADGGPPPPPPPPPPDAGPDEDAGPPPPNDVLPGYAFRAPITITGVATPLSDFPVPLTVTTAAGGAAAELVTAPAVRFTAGDGLTLLAHEVEVEGGDNRVFWIRVPTLESTTTIYAYWDNFGGDEVPPAETFDRTIFLGAWHLTEATAGYFDSTNRANTLRSALITERPAVALDGAVGGAVRFNPAAPTPLTALAVPEFELAADSFSYSLWVRADANAGEFDMPLYCGGEPNVAGFNIELGANAWNAGLSAGDGNGRYPIFTNAGDLNALHHLGVVVDRAARQMHTYFDGVFVDTATLDINDVAATAPLTVGRGVSFPYAGLVDEVRIHVGALDGAWLEAEARLTAPGAPVSLGPRESL